MTPPIIIFGYPEGCPACDNLKSLLGLLGVPFEYRPVERQSALRESLLAEGYATLPQVFCGTTGRSLGDYSDYRKVARLGLQAGGLLG